MGPDLAFYLLQVSVTHRFHNHTNPPFPTVHWEAYIEAVHRDGFTALVHLREIRDAAIAKLFSITCNQSALIFPQLIYSLTEVRSYSFHCF